MPLRDNAQSSKLWSCHERQPAQLDHLQVGLPSPLNNNRWTLIFPGNLGGGQLESRGSLLVQLLRNGITATL